MHDALIPLPLGLEIMWMIHPHKAIGGFSLRKYLVIAAASIERGRQRIGNCGTRCLELGIVFDHGGRGGNDSLIVVGGAADQQAGKYVRVVLLLFQHLTQMRRGLFGATVVLIHAGDPHQRRSRPPLLQRVGDELVSQFTAAELLIHVDDRQQRRDVRRVARICALKPFHLLQVMPGLEQERRKTTCRGNVALGQGVSFAISWRTSSGLRCATRSCISSRISRAGGKICDVIAFMRVSSASASSRRRCSIAKVRAECHFERPDLLSSTVPQSMRRSRMPQGDRTDRQQAASRPCRSSDYPGAPTLTLMSRILLSPQRRSG
ncbi:hypothetical protein [Sphingomonas suaedae]|uniref:hypothetical protein n=1 Tax=Sphingomonas suaedae TaxID=2599297 RepID=UPI003BAECF99